MFYLSKSIAEFINASVRIIFTAFSSYLALRLWYTKENRFYIPRSSYGILYLKGVRS